MGKGQGILIGTIAFSTQPGSGNVLPSSGSGGGALAPHVVGEIKKSSTA